MVLLTLTIFNGQGYSGEIIFKCTFTAAALPSDYTDTATYFLDPGSCIVYDRNGVPDISPRNFFLDFQAFIKYDGTPAESDPANIYYANGHSVNFSIDFGDKATFLNYVKYELLSPDATDSTKTMRRIDIIQGYLHSVAIYTLRDEGTGSLSTFIPFHLNFPYWNAVITHLVEPTLAVCFNQGTWIEGPNGGVMVENLNVGDLVSTYLHGHRKIARILRGISVNKDSVKAQNTMCVMNGLYLTGGHSLMVDELSAEEAEKQDAMGFSQKVDDKHLLLAMVSPLFEAAPPGTYQHYHFLLENEGDLKARYGVWANGVLCETPSQEYLESLGK